MGHSNNTWHSWAVFCNLGSVKNLYLALFLASWFRQPLFKNVSKVPRLEKGWKHCSTGLGVSRQTVSLAFVPLLSSSAKLVSRNILMDTYIFRYTSLFLVMLIAKIITKCKGLSMYFYLFNTRCNHLKKLLPWKKIF